MKVSFFSFFSFFSFSEDYFQGRKKQTRVRSLDFLKTAIVTTEEERRTRSSRHTNQRYGDVKYPMIEVAPDSDEDGPRKRKSRRGRKSSMIRDLNPISDLTLHPGSLG
ncbi:unnamed protein product [Nippostrongylus brasiliensis]|uniref:Uncharacterized protein n=1 Tax=Nippostrongylus brasiliensis TaxID=27835 RepID=A0A3P7CI89_NIPBR|nr:unnamed protein product [Nippostrongylus brasiliensis]